MNAVRALRKAMRRNRHQFGMFFGVSRETVRAWESGRAIPPEAVTECLEARA
nr:MAG TPA: putative transcriptional regulator [Caudoviricetes sp.]